MSLPPGKPAVHRLPGLHTVTTGKTGEKGRRTGVGGVLPPGPGGRALGPPGLPGWDPAQAGQGSREASAAPCAQSSSAELSAAAPHLAGSTAPSSRKPSLMLFNTQAPSPCSPRACVQLPVRSQARTWCLARRPPEPLLTPQPEKNHAATPLPAPRVSFLRADFPQPGSTQQGFPGVWKSGWGHGRAWLL